MHCAYILTQNYLPSCEISTDPDQLASFDYSKTCVKCPLKIDKTKISITNGSINEGQEYCRMFPLEQSAILLTCIKR